MSKLSKPQRILQTNKALTQLVMLGATVDQTITAVTKAIAHLSPYDKRRVDAWRLLIKFFGGDTQIGDITAPDMLQFYDWLRGKKLKYATVSRLRVPCKQVWEWGMAAGICKFNPVEMAPLDHRKFSHKQLEVAVRRPLTQQEFEQLISFLDSHKRYRRMKFLRHTASIGYYTGMRWGDIQHMQWDSFQEGRIIVHTRKVKRRISIPIDHPALGGGRLVELLADLQFDPEMDYVFPALVYLKTQPKWGRLYRMAKIENADGFYSLRHAFVTRLKANGLQLEEIASYVGHSSIKTTMNYSH